MRWALKVVVKEIKIILKVWKEIPDYIINIMVNGQVMESVSRNKKRIRTGKYQWDINEILHIKCWIIVKKKKEKRKKTCCSGHSEMPKSHIKMTGHSYFPELSHTLAPKHKASATDCQIHCHSILSVCSKL